MSIYPIIHVDEAKRYLSSRQLEDGQVHLEDIRRTAGSGEAIPFETWKKLKEDLGKLKKRFASTLRHRDPAGGKFESDACAVVHEAFLNVDRKVLADREFWVWLAVDHLSDILEWRFGTNGKPAEFANYGLGVRTENLFFRLWLRAELALVNGRDRYELARQGDQDLWRSHVIRQNYTNARNILRSLLKLQAGSLSFDKKRAKPLASGEEKLGIRMLAKRLKRLRANIVFEYLTQPQADALVFELSSDLKKGN